jgi:hypothetical protein
MIFSFFQHLTVVISGGDEAFPFRSNLFEDCATIFRPFD